MQDTLSAVLDLVRQQTGVDFSRYRVATMQRRVRNHMLAIGVPETAEYVRRLQESRETALSLLGHLTIKVSAFYRNPVAFDALRLQVLPELARQAAHRPLTIWSAGCGRGEEAYTLAMLCDAANIDCRIVATDIDEAALAAARDGLYDAMSLETMPTDLRERYTEPVSHRGRSMVRVHGRLRDAITFVRHDLTVAPVPAPGTFDLLCCRNVLIYLQRDLHETVMARLRQAVREGGFLCLGEAEWPTTEVMTSLCPLPRATRLFRASPLMGTPPTFHPGSR